MSANGAKRRKPVADRYQKRPMGPRYPRENVEDYIVDVRDAQPSAARIQLLGAATAEAERREAVEALLALARAEIAKTGSAAQCFQIVSPTNSKEEPIWEFLVSSALQILVADNPVAALKRFLGRHQSRPPEDNRWRDFTIWGDVQKLHDSGMSIRDACKQIGDAAGLGPVRVVGIYLAERKAREQQKDDPIWQHIIARFEGMGVKRDEISGRNLHKKICYFFIHTPD